MFNITVKDFNRNGTVVGEETLIQTIPAASEGGLRLINPIVKNEMGNAESLDFSIEGGTPFYDAFLQMKTFIRITYDGDTIFYGRVLSVDNSGFQGTRRIRCEGPISFLLDTPVEGVEEKKRASISTLAYIQQLLNNHNNYSESNNKKFYIGNVPGHYESWVSSEQQIKNDIRNFGSDSWTETKTALEDLRSHYGGYFRTRAGAIGSGIYLDWMDHYFNPSEISQTIEVGKNVLDISNVTEIDNIFTAIVPIGRNPNTKDNADPNIYLDGKILRVPDIVPFYGDQLNSGYHRREYYEQAINKYGLIFKTVSFNDATTKDKLLSDAREWIKNNYQGDVTKFTIKAMDMHQIGDRSISKIMVGDRVRIIYPVGDENGTFTKKEIVLTCLSISFDLYHPENNSYTFGIPANVLTKTYGLHKQGKSVDQNSTKPSSGGYSSPKRETSTEDLVLNWLRKNGLFWKSRGKTEKYVYNTNTTSNGTGPNASNPAFLGYVNGWGADGWLYKAKRKLYVYDVLLDKYIEYANKTIKPAVNLDTDRKYDEWSISSYITFNDNSVVTLEKVKSHNLFEYIKYEYNGFDLLAACNGGGIISDEEGNISVVEKMIDPETGEASTELVAIFDATEDTLAFLGPDGQVIKSLMDENGDWHYYYKDKTGKLVETTLRNLHINQVEDERKIGWVVSEDEDGELQFDKPGEISLAIENHFNCEMVVARVNGELMYLGNTKTQFNKIAGDNIVLAGNNEFSTITQTVTRQGNQIGVINGTASVMESDKITQVAGNFTYRYVLQTKAQLEAIAAKGVSPRNANLYLQSSHMVAERDFNSAIELFNTIGDARQGQCLLTSRAADDASDTEKAKHIQLGHVYVYMEQTVDNEFNYSKSYYKKTLYVISGGGMVVRENNNEWGMYHDGNLVGGIIVDKINDDGTVVTKIKGDRVDVEASQVRIGTASNVKEWMELSDEEFDELEGLVADKITAYEAHFHRIDTDTDNTKAWMDDMDEDFDALEGLVADKITAYEARFHNIESDYLKTKNLSASISNLTTVSVRTLLVSNHVQSDGPIWAKNYYLGTPDSQKNMSNALIGGSISRSGNTYTLTLNDFNGNEVEIGTFSRATSLSGKWSGDKYEVTASPQGNKASTTLYAVRDKGSTSSTTNEKFMNTNIQISWDGDPDNNRATHTMDKNIIIDASPAWQKGHNTGWDNARAAVAFPESGSTTSITVQKPNSSRNGTESRVYTLANKNDNAVVLRYQIPNTGNYTNVAELTHGKYNSGWDAARNVSAFPGSGSTSSITVKIPNSSRNGAESRVYSITNSGNNAVVLRYQIPNTGNYVNCATFTHNKYTSGVNSVTLNDPTWGSAPTANPSSNSNSMTVSTSTGAQKSRTFYLAAGGWSSNKNTVYLSHTSTAQANRLAKLQIDATSIYNNGVSDGVTNSAPSGATLGTKVPGTTWWNVSIQRSGGYAAVGKTINLANAYTDARSGYYTKSQYDANYTSGYNSGYSSGYSSGSNDGYSNGYNAGYDVTGIGVKNVNTAATAAGSSYVSGYTLSGTISSDMRKTSFYIRFTVYTHEKSFKKYFKVN